MRGVEGYVWKTMQGYCACKKQPPPQVHIVGLCIGPYGGPGRGAVSDEQGTPARTYGGPGGGVVSSERGTPVRAHGIELT